MRVEHIGLATLYLGDCREVLPTLAPCDLILFPNSDHGLSDDPDCSERYYALFKEYELKYFGY